MMSEKMMKRKRTIMLRCPILFPVLLLLLVGYMACDLPFCGKKEEKKVEYKYNEPISFPCSRKDFFEVTRDRYDKLLLEEVSLETLHQLSDEEFYKLLDKAGIVGCVSHGEWYRFSEINEIKAFVRYKTVTEKDGHAWTGKYGVMARMVNNPKTDKPGVAGRPSVQVLEGPVLIDRFATQPPPHIRWKKVVFGEIISRESKPNETSVDDTHPIEINELTDTGGRVTDLGISLLLYPNMCKEEDSKETNPKDNIKNCLRLELKDNKGKVVQLESLSDSERFFIPKKYVAYSLRVYGNLDKKAPEGGYLLVMSCGRHAKLAGKLQGLARGVEVDSGSRSGEEIEATR